VTLEHWLLGIASSGAFVDKGLRGTLL